MLAELTGVRVGGGWTVRVPSNTKGTPFSSRVWAVSWKVTRENRGLSPFTFVAEKWTHHDPWNSEHRKWAGRG